ncbi:MAG: [protein-PII] uridylyltransferase family protein, partial [Acidimicrobiales bacterium]
MSTLAIRLCETQPAAAERLEHDEELTEALVAVAGASRALGELCVSDPLALDALAGAREGGFRFAPVDGSGSGLARAKRLALLVIAARDLLGLDDLSSVGHRLSELAVEVLRAAVAAAGVGDRLAVVAMGKLGGDELNYASDIDVVFVGEDQHGAMRVMELARSCYRVDADLRPEGRNGPLARSLASWEAYWDRWAETWEFQALLKARPVAGDRGLGRAFAAAVEERLWIRPFGPDELRSIRSMKARAEGEVSRRGLAERELKRGPGGIRDVEFAVQLLQLVHGRADPDLRSPTTLDALGRLAGGGYVDRRDALAMDGAYRFLRAVEHRLQLVDEQQVHALPTDAAAREHLARVMGYRDGIGRSAVDGFDAELRRHRSTVRTVHERLFFRPLLDALVSARASGPAASGEGLSEEAVKARLAAFGFSDADRTRVALTELTRGLTRPSRLMQQMMPLLLGWLSETPDPDLGLLGLRRLVGGRAQSVELSVAFRESPESARRLCVLLGTSALLAETMLHQPDVVPRLAEAAELHPRSRAELVGAALDAMGWRSGLEARRAALRRFTLGEELRVAARDVLSLDAPTPETGSPQEPAGLPPSPGSIPPAQNDAAGTSVALVGRRLSALAEAVLEAGLEAVSPEVPFSVVALGRLGGA